MNIKTDFLKRLKNQRDSFYQDLLYRFLNPPERDLVKSIFKGFHIYESTPSLEYSRLLISDSETDPNFKIKTLKSSYQDDYGCSWSSNREYL